MKTSLRLLVCSLLFCASVPLAHSQPTTFTLNPLVSFGINGDGSIVPGDSIGFSPFTGNEVAISAPGGYGIQPGDSTSGPNSTNGYNMRGLAYDPVSGNLVFVDTHTGSGGSTGFPPNAAVYILDRDSGQIIGALNTNGLANPAGGIGWGAAVGVADDGVVYVACQLNYSTNGPFRINRWATADTNNPAFNDPSLLAFNSTLFPPDRMGQTMDVRGSGTNTQIIVGTSALSAGTTGTNVYLFTTTDGTNFTAHRLSFPGLDTPVFNDGIAFGPTNTFWAKQVGKPLLYLAYDPVNFTDNSVIASFAASSPNDPLLNLSALAVDNANHLLASLEEIGGIANGGRGKVWLFDIFDPSNRAPAVLASRTYTPNFVKATAPMGYLDFGGGRVYANVVNNGLLASTVDSAVVSPPSFTIDLPHTNRVAAGQSVHFEVFAVADVTNYQWYSNNVPISGANTYYLDLPNVQTNVSGSIYKVIAYNAAGSVESVHCTLLTISAADFYHPTLLWSFTPGATNYISSAASGTPPERTIAYNALSNQLLVARGPSAFANMKIFVVDADTGEFLYLLNTNGMSTGGALNLVGIGVADDGAVYGCSVNAGTDPNSFRVYRWANSDPNTVPQFIFGTNSSAATANPIEDLVGTTSYRFGDNLAVHGAGNNTEIILDSQNSSKFVGILRPVPDGTMTNWTQTGYLLQNIQGSYGSEAYGTAIGRSLQFGNGSTFWQKRYSAAGTPLAGMSYTPGGGLALLSVANVSLPLFTNGPAAVSFTLNVAAAVGFAGTVGNNLTVPDTLDYYDVSDPSQAILLSRQNLPGGNSGNHLANGNAIAQVIFGFNPATGSNYLFAIQGNNGIAGYVLQGGITPPPVVLVQPADLRVLEGSTGSLTVSLNQPATIAWYKGTNSPVATGVTGNSYDIANAQSSDGGDYFAIASNVNGAVTSAVAHVSIVSADGVYTLSPSWAATPGDANFPYVTSDGGPNTPNERSFAYNALSNQLIVVRCPPASTVYSVYAVDAATGTSLYTLDTSTVIHQGPSEVSGSNPIDLVAAAVADDGAVYICSETPNASGGDLGDPTKMLAVYRWADTSPSTVPTLIFQGDPSGQPPGVNVRWGDVMAARGSGTNTELILNSHDGAYAAVLQPTNSSMSWFTNRWFTDSSGAGSIGRSIQFGPTNTVFEKRKGAALFFSGYDLTNGTSASLGAVASSPTLGGVFVDTSKKVAAGVDFVGSRTAPLRPDAVSLYDLSDPAAPLLVGRYNFPLNQIQNANFICQTVITGYRVYSLDANNGLAAFLINPPPNAMVLSVISSGANLNLSWGNPDAILQGTPSLSPPSWSDLSTAGQTNSVQPASGGSNFYRLILRR